MSGLSIQMTYEELKAEVLKKWSEGFSFSEIGLMLDKSRNTVSGIINRENKKRIQKGIPIVNRENLNARQRSMVGNSNHSKEQPITMVTIAEPVIKPVDEPEINIEPIFNVVIKEFVPMSRSDSIVNAKGCRYFINDIDLCNKPLKDRSMWCEIHYNKVYLKREIKHVDSK